jgi:hypothetical protein
LGDNSALLPFGVDDYGRPFDTSTPSDDAPGLLPGSGESAGSYLYRAATGSPSPSQVQNITDKCAQDNQRASGGRLSLDQARAQCAGDINSVLAKQPAKPWGWILAALGLAAVAIGVAVKS